MRVGRSSNSRYITYSSFSKTNSVDVLMICQSRPLKRPVSFFEPKPTPPHYQLQHRFLHVCTCDKNWGTRVPMHEKGTSPQNEPHRADQRLPNVVIERLIFEDGFVSVSRSPPNMTPLPFSSQKTVRISPSFPIPNNLLVVQMAFWWDTSTSLVPSHSQPPAPNPHPPSLPPPSSQPPTAPPRPAWSAAKSAQACSTSPTAPRNMPPHTSEIHLRLAVRVQADRVRKKA